MLFTRLGRFVLGKPVPKVLSPIWTFKLVNNTYLLLKGMFYIKETSKRLSISRYLLHLKARKN